MKKFTRKKVIRNYYVKKIVALLSITALCFLCGDSAHPVLAQEVYSDVMEQLFAYEVENEQVTITGYEVDKYEKLVIPDMIDEKKVVGVKLDSCVDSTLKELTIGQYVQSSSEDLGLNVKYGLEKIHVASGNQKYFSRDGVLYSKDQKRLLYYPISKKDDEFHLPAKVTEVSIGAINAPLYLKRLYLNRSVEKLGGISFCGLQKISFRKKSVITDLYEESFLDLTQLEKISLPESLIYIHQNAFKRCPKLKKVTIPRWVLNIEKGAFSGCPNIKLSKPSYLKKQKDGSYHAMVKVTGQNKKIGMEKINALRAKNKKIVSSIGKSQKIRVQAQCFGKWKGLKTPVVMYSSSNKKVIVSKNGVVRAKQKGMAVVTGKAIIAGETMKFRVKVVCH